MAPDDTGVDVESSVGPLRIVFGWNAWVSVHAAAVVIAPEPLTNIVPLQRLTAELWKQRPRESRRGCSTQDGDGDRRPAGERFLGSAG